jgi:hypothetical protein
MEQNPSEANWFDHIPRLYVEHEKLVTAFTRNHRLLLSYAS